MAVAAARVSVTTTATRLDGAADADANPGQHVLVRNRDAALSVFIGKADVTASTGFEVLAGETLGMDNFGGDAIYGITSSGTALCHVMQSGV